MSDQLTTAELKLVALVYIIAFSAPIASLQDNLRPKQSSEVFKCSLQFSVLVCHFSFGYDFFIRSLCFVSFSDDTIHCLTIPNSHRQH